MKERPAYLPSLPPLPRLADFLPSLTQPTAPLPQAIDTPSALSHPTGEALPSPLPPESLDPYIPDEQERVRLLGRLGHAVRFRTNARGVTVAEFPIAIRHDDDSTTWHTVVAFGPRAEALRNSLAKGQHAEVIGYKHVSQYTSKKDGTTKTKTEIYAARVIPR